MTYPGHRITLDRDRMYPGFLLAVLDPEAISHETQSGRRLHPACPYPGGDHGVVCLRALSVGDKRASCNASRTEWLNSGLGDSKPALGARYPLESRDEAFGDSADGRLISA